MTLERLNEHLSLVERYLEAKEIAQRLRDSLGLKAQAYTGMPHGTGTEDTVGNTVVEVIRLEEKAKQLEFEVLESQKPIEAWIDTVEDICVQTVLRLRYIHGMKWQEVADMVGGENTSQSVRMSVYRILT